MLLSRSHSLSLLTLSTLHLVLQLCLSLWRTGRDTTPSTVQSHLPIWSALQLLLICCSHNSTLCTLPVGVLLLSPTACSERKVLPRPGQDDDNIHIVVQGQEEELTERAAVLPAARQRGPKANRHKPAAAASLVLTARASAAQDSDARGSHTGMSGAQDSDDHHSAAQLAPHMQEDPETQQQADTGVTQRQAEPHLAETEADMRQHSSRGTESHQPQHQQLDAVGQASTTQPHTSAASQRAESQPADSATLSEAQEDQQQLQQGQALLPGLLGVLRKEALCLRVRPLDALTKRLMQALGCTALLELPNNK